MMAGRPGQVFMQHLAQHHIPATTALQQITTITESTSDAVSDVNNMLERVKWYPFLRDGCQSVESDNTF